MLYLCIAWFDECIEHNFIANYATDKCFLAMNKGWWELTEWGVQRA